MVFLNVDGGKAPNSGGNEGHSDCTIVTEEAAQHAVRSTRDVAVTREKRC